MGRQNQRNQGFTIIELVIIFVIVGVLCAVGFILYQQTHRPAAQSVAPQKSQTGLYVKEWGVRLVLTDPVITDAYYTAPAVEPSSGIDYIGLGTKGTNVELECDDGSHIQQTTIDVIYRNADKDKVVNGVSSEARKVGDYYYSIQYTGGAGCDAVSATAPRASVLSKQFIQNFEAGNLVLNQ